MYSYAVFITLIITLSFKYVSQFTVYVNMIRKHYNVRKHLKKAAVEECNQTV